MFKKENIDLISIEETAAILDVSISGLHRIRIDERLNFPSKIKVRNRVFFAREEIEQ